MSNLLGLASEVEVEHDEGAYHQSAQGDSHTQDDLESDVCFCQRFLVVQLVKKAFTRKGQSLGAKDVGFEVGSASSYVMRLLRPVTVHHGLEVYLDHAFLKASHHEGVGGLLSVEGLLGQPLPVEEGELHLHFLVQWTHFVVCTRVYRYVGEVSSQNRGLKHISVLKAHPFLARIYASLLCNVLAYEQVLNVLDNLEVEVEAGVVARDRVQVVGWIWSLTAALVESRACYVHEALLE